MERVQLSTPHKSRVHSIIVTHRLALAKPRLGERLLAEFVGTFFLVLTVGVAAVGGGSMAPVAIGLVLAAQIYTFAAVSGGFLNPAVTLAVRLSGRQKISLQSALLYVVVQCLGAVIGGLCAFAATGSTFRFAFGAGRGLGTSIELEVLFTMALCSIVLSAVTSNDSPNHHFGFAVGVTSAALTSGAFGQGSFNPAVTLGVNVANFANASGPPAPSAGSWAVFLLAPLLGGALAAALFRGTRSNEYGRAAEGAAAAV